MAEKRIPLPYLWIELDPRGFASLSKHVRDFDIFALGRSKRAGEGGTVVTAMPGGA